MQRDVVLFTLYVYQFGNLKELIYMFGSSYKKVNTTPEEVSLYKKVG